MPEQFLHGVEVVQIDTGARPIRTVRSSVIGLIGTAPGADETTFPLNTPVLIAGNRTEAALLGDTGTLPAAIDGIFDQAGAVVVVVRVEESTDTDPVAAEAETIGNIIGGVDAG
ncbi:MAG: phage tail protein, partial [Gammaproteobacteria bacterium]|nr:phage tail protein [Gammaproteobacteria bacterium]